MRYFWLVLTSVISFTLGLPQTAADGQMVPNVAFYIRRKVLLEDGGPNRTIRILVLAPESPKYPYSLFKVLAAVEFAVQKLEAQGRNGPLGGRSVKIYEKNTHCSSTLGPLAAFDSYITGEVDVFLGPLCPYVLGPLSRYTAVWDIPLLTAGGQNDNFDQKKPYYSLLTRMNGSYTQIGHIFLKILRRFHWHVIALLFHNFSDHILGNSNCYFTLSAVYRKLNREVYYLNFDETDPKTNYSNILKDVTQHARVIVMCASPNTVREILLAAEELNMVDKGEYVFFSTELFTSKKENANPWMRKGDSQTRNKRARKAYEALLTVTARKPETPEYAEFSRTVKDIAKKKFGFDYGEEEVNTYVTAFHEAVLLYVLALNETLEEGGHITNGSIITQKMWNRTFE
ncbi:atrial natriuretic peptide receptor 3-like, partial [Limulus polyphemus]|uniref:Atrial natriuretic peptide receptor 3-like n=1 Tax=Limulus polyphemus TaxID=6850 RepID=A0ABM1BSK8_LIMPO